MADQDTLARLVPPAQPPAQGRVLHLLAQGFELTRIEAERLAGAHALPTTIADLRNRHGLRDYITAAPRIVYGLHASRTRMAGYSLSREHAALALAFRLLWSWGWRGDDIEPPAPADPARPDTQPDLFGEVLGTAPPHPAESPTGRGVRHG